MIPKLHEALGHLVTRETDWYRPMNWRIDDEKEMEQLKHVMRNEHDTVFGVVSRRNGMPDWGFIKAKPFETLVEENGPPEAVINNWKGRYEGTRFANGEVWYVSDTPSNVSVEEHNDGRCEGVTQKGTRCTGHAKWQWGNYCSRHKSQGE